MIRFTALSTGDLVGECFDRADHAGTAIHALPRADE
jgi:hypothetical protein